MDNHTIRVNYENVSDEDWQEWCESDGAADYYSTGAQDGIEELVVTAPSRELANRRVAEMLKPGMKIQWLRPLKVEIMGCGPAGDKLAAQLNEEGFDASTTN